MRPTASVRLAIAGTAVVCLAAGAVQMSRSPAPRPSLARKDQPPAMPSRWLWEQRSFPFGTIDHQAYLAAIEQGRFDRAAEGLSVNSSLLTWQPVGPTNIGGRVTALAVAPGGSTIYMASANGGVFKSIDGGINWSPIFDEYSIYSIGSLALDPTDSAIVYVGTGESNPAFGTYDGAGMYRSTDGGSNWQPLGLKDTRRIARIAIDPTNTARIYAASMGTVFQTNPNGGIWRTTDGGSNWTQTLFVNQTTGASDVVINPANPESVWCATWDDAPGAAGGGIWVSGDFGSNWLRLGVANGLPAPSDSVGRIALAIAPSKPTTLYAQIMYGPVPPATPYKGRGMFRSTNGGSTWSRRDVGTSFANNFGGFGWYFGDMGIDPTNPDKVFALGVNLLVSSDGGQSYSTLTGFHVDQHAIWIDPSDPMRIYLGNDGGFYASASGGGSWVKALGLPISQFYDIAVDPSNPSRLYGGTQDNNTLKTDGSASGWFPILGGDGFYCVVDPTTPTTLLAEFQNCCSGTGPRRSTNGGGSFTSPSGFNTGHRYNWNTPVVMDPSDHNVVLVGSQYVYRSVNNGVSYATVSGTDLAFNPASSRPNGTITTLDISPLSPLIYLSGSSNGKVWRTRDRGATWEDITNGLPLRSVTRVVCDLSDSSTVYVTLSGYSQGEHVAHIHRSTDLGDTWTPIDGNLPSTPINDLIIDPLDPNRLYAGTEVGAYTTRNLGSTWYPLGQGMPFQAIWDLVLHNPTRTLFAGTYGRSMWKLDLGEMPTAVGAPTALDRLTLSAPTPNPSRRGSSFAVDLSSAARGEVSVFDAMGRRVRTLERGRLEAGSRSYTWDGRDDAGRPTGAGVYFVRVAANESTRMRRLVRTP